jgi:hypothetical protein
VRFIFDWKLFSKTCPETGCPVTVHPLVKVKFKDFSRPFVSKFKDLELGKIFENGTDLPEVDWDKVFSNFNQNH